MDSKVSISFDELNRIRLLDPEQFKHAESLADESGAFVSKVEQFAQTTEALVAILTEQSKKIEQEKLMAIGMRNRVASEIETRKSREKELQALIDQKQLELDRQIAYYESLKKVEQEQRTVLDKLTKSE